MNAVEINNLSWKYIGKDEFAITDINIEIESGKFIGVIGPNEAGKTTFISAIKGLIPENYTGVYRGEVKVFGHVVKDTSPRQMARLVGMVFADPDAQFNSMSVEEELSFGMENIGCTIEEIHERLDWVKGITNIGSLMERPPYHLSGGQKQRIAIASVLALRPKIIILDEPTSMLDPISKDMVFDLLRIMKQELDLTVIVVEHNIEKLVELADKLILINGGKIEKYCDTQEMFKDISYLESRNIRIPGAIKFMHMVDEKKGITDSPIHFDEICTRLSGYAKAGER